MHAAEKERRTTNHLGTHSCMRLWVLEALRLPSCRQSIESSELLLASAITGPPARHQCRPPRGGRLPDARRILFPLPEGENLVGGGDFLRLLLLLLLRHTAAAAQATRGRASLLHLIITADNFDSSLSATRVVRGEAGGRVVFLLLPPPG